MVIKIARKPNNDFIRHLRESQNRDMEGWKCKCDIPGHGEFDTLVFDGDYESIECPICREERRKAEERKKAEQEFYDSLIKDNGVPADNYMATFEKFEIREDEGEQVKFEDGLALRAVKALYDSIGSRDPYSAVRNVTICGKTGNGKSYLGAAMVSAAKKDGKKAFYIQDSALLSMVLACGKGKGNEADNLRRRFEEYDVLVIDDADQERWHAAKCAFFADMVISRNSAMKGLLILSNRTYQEYVSAFGSAVESRLKRGKVISWIHGTDRRERQKKQEVPA